MPWDQDTVKRHEAWFDSPVGRFALARELHLVDTVIADWPRRNQRLVEIGCGLGIFLEEFWRGGLDITGLDNSPAMIAACRERLGHRAELFLGNADHLPFEDKEFDYAALVTLLEFCPDPGAVLREATRTAKKGLVLAFLNRWSLYAREQRKVGQKNGQKNGLDTTLSQARWFSWPEISRLICAHVGHKPTLARSILAGPPSTWKDRPGLRQMNSLICPPFLGAFTVVRVDFIGEKPLTPLPAWTTEAGMGGA